MKNIIIGLLIVNAVVCHGYNTYVSGGPVDVHVEVINPKYSLQEAIDVAIADLEARHQEVNYSTLKRRVEKMPKGDVCIGEQNEFRQAIRWAIEKYEIKGNEQIAAQYSAPNPKGMKQDEFVESYITYRQQTLSPAEAKKIKGRIDGMRGYDRAMKNEAIKLWRAANKK